jgi:predicted nucleic acid-binding protein
VTTPAVMLDTNVVSELMRHEPHPGVARFVGFLPSPLLSVAVLHELVYGIELLPAGANKMRLSALIDSIRTQFDACLVAVDDVIARVSGELRAQVELRGGELKPMDALIAASALCRSASLATRNLKHFAGLGIDLVNPWTA